MEEIVFEVTTCEESGVLVASWDDPSGGGITTEARNEHELERESADALECHFGAGWVPPRIILNWAGAGALKPA